MQWWWYWLCFCMNLLGMQWWWHWLLLLCSGEEMAVNINSTASLPKSRQVSTDQTMEAVAQEMAAQEMEERWGETALRGRRSDAPSIWGKDLVLGWYMCSIALPSCTLGWHLGSLVETVCSSSRLMTQPYQSFRTFLPWESSIAAGMVTSGDIPFHASFELWNT